MLGLDLITCYYAIIFVATPLLFVNYVAEHRVAKADTYVAEPSSGSARKYFEQNLSYLRTTLGHKKVCLRRHTIQ